VKELDAGISVSGIASMEEMIAEANGPTRFYATLVAIFAALALLLAAVGIYGVMSYAVTQRTQEIGVRLALGATARQIFGLVVGESLKLAAVGLVLGVAGAIAVGRAMDTLLFGVAATDILTFGLTAAVLTMVAVLASYMPARRAMRTDPMTALRTE
jgi:putative ABC transport system permease protein